MGKARKLEVGQVMSLSNSNHEGNLRNVLVLCDQVQLFSAVFKFAARLSTESPLDLQLL